MLALKLLLVPSFLLLVSLATRWLGPALAGWLAALPVIVGPVLFIVALETGPAFAASAAVSSTGGVAAAVAFGATYAHAARRWTWPGALAAGWAAWGAVAFGLSLLPHRLALMGSIALATLLLAPRLFPPGAKRKGQRLGAANLALRMVAGALLTLVVAELAPRVGGAWSGLIAVFPLLASLLAVFSHRDEGAPFVATLLAGMAAGFHGMVAFCVVLALALPTLGIGAAFALAIATNVIVQAASRRLLGARNAAA